MEEINVTTEQLSMDGRDRGLSDPIKFRYRFDSTLFHGAQELNGKQVQTVNKRGVQMSTVSPLFDIWVKNYKPGTLLADVGTAYGINTLTAINNYNITDALIVDMTQEHLDYVFKHHAKHSKNKNTSLQSALTKLPELNGVEKESVSSLLCAEVIHFLNGKEVTLAFQRFHDVLIPGGALVLTCCSTRAMEDNFPAYSEAIKDQKKNGVEFYGYIDKVKYAKILESAWENSGDEFNEHSRPDLLHAFDIQTLTRIAENTGFVVELIGMKSHPGYPKIAKGPYANVQAVFRKIN